MREDKVLLEGLCCKPFVLLKLDEFRETELGRGNGRSPSRESIRVEGEGRVPDLAGGK